MNILFCNFYYKTSENILTTTDTDTDTVRDVYFLTFIYFAYMCLFIYLLSRWDSYEDADGETHESDEQINK